MWPCAFANRTQTFPPNNTLVRPLNDKDRAVLTRYLVWESCSQGAPPKGVNHREIAELVIHGKVAWEAALGCDIDYVQEFSGNGIFFKEVYSDSKICEFFIDSRDFGVVALDYTAALFSHIAFVFYHLTKLRKVTVVKPTPDASDGPFAAEFAARHSKRFLTELRHPHKTLLQFIDVDEAPNFRVYRSSFNGYPDGDPAAPVAVSEPSCGVDAVSACRCKDLHCARKADVCKLEEACRPTEILGAAVRGSA